MLRVFLTMLVAACAVPCGAIAAETAPRQGAFLSESGCFDSTPDYQGWLQATAAGIEYRSVTPEMLAKVVPEKAFAFARTGLDCRVVTYASGGHVISGYVVRPRRDNPGDSLPLLVYNRGGNRDFGRIDSLQLFRKLLPLAKAGYVVVASQYRGDADEFGGQDVDDVMRLIDLSRAMPGVDAGRIYMLGESRGAMMSYLVARQRDDITAMATAGGATDLLAGLEWRPEMEQVFRALIPGYDAGKQAALEARSALRWAEELPADMPVLLLHGEADDRVSVEDSRAMAARLQRLGRPHKLVVYAGDDHGIRQNRQAALIEVLDWFGTGTTRQPHRSPVQPR